MAIQHESLHRNQRQAEAVAAVGTPPHTSTEDEVPDTHPKKRGSPRLKDSQRSKSYRRISHLENELEEKERVINRPRQREYRRKTENLKVPMDKQFPRTRSESFIKKANSLKNPIVRKSLIFHNALIDDLRKIRQCDQKKLLNLVRLDILRKYRCQNMLQNATKISRKIINQQLKKRSEKSLNGCVNLCVTSSLKMTTQGYLLRIKTMSAMNRRGFCCIP